MIKQEPIDSSRGDLQIQVDTEVDSQQNKRSNFLTTPINSQNPETIHDEDDSISNKRKSTENQAQPR